MERVEMQGDAIPRLANCGRYQATDNTGQHYYLNHANEWQTFQGAQVSGGGEWERAEFEKAAVTVDMNLHHDSGGYEDEITEDAWKLWLARAALSTPQARPVDDSTDYDCPDCGKLNYKPLRCQNCGHDPEQARPDGGEVIRWPNWCDTSVPEALRYLSKNERPKGGCERFNAEHLLQLANEIELMAKKLREAHPAPAPDVARLVELAEDFTAKGHHSCAADLRAILTAAQQEAGHASK